ncbi:unnamed protein product, partial [Iphiclides podalirius]
MTRSRRGAEEHLIIELMRIRIGKLLRNDGNLAASRRNRRVDAPSTQDATMHVELSGRLSRATLVRLSPLIKAANGTMEAQEVDLERPDVAINCPIGSPTLSNTTSDELDISIELDFEL